MKIFNKKGNQSAYVCTMSTCLADHHFLYLQTALKTKKKVISDDQFGIH